MSTNPTSHTRVPHPKAILCPICGKMDFTPVIPHWGMPACTCLAAGTRPCTVYPCLSCIDKSLRAATLETQAILTPPWKVKVKIA